MKKSFTLIELLVVLAIIGILAAMIIASLSGARARARDATRKSDLRQVKTALEQYYSDKEQYKIQTAPMDLNVTNTDLTTEYIKNMPNEPKPGLPPYKYQTNSDGTAYCLYSILENTKDPDYDKAPPTGFSLPSGYHYSMCSD
jgi:type II secretion system protein G